MKCPYRADKECIERPSCNVCLLGQIADNTDLIYSAIMSLSADKLEKEAERLCKERQK